jgi:hypothetical protein
MFDVKWLSVELALINEEAQGWSDAMKASYAASLSSLRREYPKPPIDQNKLQEIAEEKAA